MTKPLFLVLAYFLIIGVNIFNPACSQAAPLSINRVAGKILLEVEAHGEAWYVHPLERMRYYLGRPADAFALMRQHGLGISNKDLARLLGTLPASPPTPMYTTKSMALAQRLSGRIILQVEQHGEAYYISPKDLRGYYLGTPSDAFRIMRLLGEGILSSDLAQIPVATGATPQSVDTKISDFLAWAKAHEIEIVAVDKNTDYFYYQGGKPEDFSDPKDVPNLLEVAEGLYQIPERLVVVLKGKTLYASRLQGRGYAVLGSWPEQNILVGMNRGIILEQRLQRENVVHEVGHIIDYHGIRGLYDDPQYIFGSLEPLRKEIFSVDFPYDPNRPEPPAGYLNVYSTANDAENFSEHFAAYIFKAQEFRSRAASDALLKKKYDFFKNNLFNGREY